MNTAHRFTLSAVALIAVVGAAIPLPSSAAASTNGPASQSASSSLVPGSPSGFKAWHYLRGGAKKVGPLVDRNSQDVQRLAAVLNSLKPVQPGIYHCPGGLGGWYVVKFLYAAKRVPIVVEPSGCQWAWNRNHPHKRFWVDQAVLRDLGKAFHQK
jgi:hypothetical protein